jgi:predicted amidohydrolase YtcJ
MSDVTRGEFLGIGAALAGGLAFGCAPSGSSTGGAQSVGRPDLVVVNGRVYTVDEVQPTAEAFAVKDGRFVSVGSTADVQNLVGPGTEVIDAAGMTVTPGFIDAHSHPAGAGVNELVHVNVDLRSVAAIQEVLGRRAAETPAGEWVIGFKYDDTKLSEGRPVNRVDLDAVSTEHPIVIRHRGGHTAVFNSKAFELAGVTVNTPDPIGGAFYRENGELTGKVAEHAMDAWDGLIPSGSTREQRQAGVRLITELMTAAGLTTVHHTGCSPNDMVAYQDAYRAGELRLRIYALPRGSTYPALSSAGVRTGFGDEWLRVGAVKFAADGSASERTMAMSTPYVGRPDDYGILTMTQEEIHEVVEEAHRNGWQIGIHANGDLAIDMVLNAYERVQELWPRPDPRHRIEHCTLVNDDLLTRIKAVGAIPTPFYTYVHYHGNKWLDYGEERMKTMFAHRSFLDHDIPVPGASDYTPGPYEPMMALQSMVTRKDFQGRIWGENQRVTVDEALRICTLNGAHASFEEDVKGSITAGKLADFVILAEDPHEVDPDALKEIGIVRTVVNGKTMHEA